MNKGTKILLVLSLIGIVAGIAVYFEASEFQKKAKVTEGIVENRRISSFHVIYSSDDGVKHDLYISQKNNRLNDGDKVKVFYRMDNSTNARINDGKKGGKKIVIISIVLLLFDFFMMYNNRRNMRISDNFKNNGRKVKAEILSVDIDITTTILRKHPIIIKCKWNDPITGKEYIHTLRYIWNHPDPPVAGHNTIDVYIDRENPDKYFIDTDFPGLLLKG
jgi:hypothetical protein